MTLFDYRYIILFFRTGMFLLCLGSFFYSFYYNKDAVELSNQIQSFCKKGGIEDMTECLRSFKLSDKNTDMEEKVGVMSKKIVNLVNTTDKLIESNQSLSNELNTCKIMNMETKTELQIVTDDLNTAKKQNVKNQNMIDTMKDELERHGLNMSVVKSYQEYADNSKTEKSTFVLVSIILGVGEFIIIVLLCNRGTKQIQQRIVTAQRQQQNGDTRLPNGVRSILDEINKKNDLENSLCIVSFTSQTETKHCEMVNSFIDNGIQKKSYIVNRAGDLKEIPPSKICVVFIDYNSRNIILESENELGDLKKTTVKAIWKMGGDVILVYCGDDLSKVSGTELYNRRLSSIEKQEELKQLDSQQHVLSVYQNKFTDHQKQHLRNLTGQLKKA